jgi:hypothetical protein
MKNAKFTIMGEQNRGCYTGVRPRIRHIIDMITCKRRDRNKKTAIAATSVDVVQWQPPPISFVKCKLDAIICMTCNKVGMKTCIHGEKCNFYQII